MARLVFRGPVKPPRTESVTVRLDPKLRYLAELAARKQRRTLSSLIEWAIEEGLKRVAISEDFSGQPTFISDVAERLWDVYDADRFARLAFRYPELLTHEEQILWKLIRENGFIWKGHYDPNDEGRWKWTASEEALILDRLRDTWKDFLQVAADEAPTTALPQWRHKITDPVPASLKAVAKTPQKPTTGDDIPF